MSAIQGTNSGIWGHLNQSLIMTRMQDHMVVTANGDYHALVNLGPGTGLVMMTSTDAGATWAESFAIPNTGLKSTADIQLLPDGETLLVSYVDADDRVAYAAYDYDTVAGEWTTTTQAIVEASSIDAESVHPTVAQGPRGCLIVSFMEETDRGMRLVVSASLNGGDTWIPVETEVSDATKGSARIISTSEETGLLVTTDTSMNWVSFSWREGVTIEEIVSGPTAGKYASHFSTAVYGEDIYVATSDESGHLIFTWYDGSSETWQDPVSLTLGYRQATSAQISVSDEGNLYITFDDQAHDVLVVIESTDGGLTWQNKATLVYPSTIVDPPMRFEAPDYFVDDLVVLQQIAAPENEDLHGLFCYRIGGLDVGEAETQALNTILQTAEPGPFHLL